MNSDTDNLKGWGIFAAYLLVFIYGLSYWGSAPHDPDLSWHLLGGAWQKSVESLSLAEDPINAFRVFWHDYHWLWQLFIYRIFELYGYQGQLVFLGIFTGITAVVMLDTARLCTDRKRLSFYHVLFVVYSLYLIQFVTTLRPHTVSILSVTIAVNILLRRNVRLELLYLLLLSVLLVNVHVYWIFIPFLWGVFRCVALIFKKTLHRPEFYYSFGGLAVLSAAGLVSPYGLFSDYSLAEAVFSNYALLWDYIQTPDEFKSRIQEFAPGLTRGYVQLPVIASMLFVSRFLRKKQLFFLAPQIVLYITGLLLVYKAVKFIPIFCIFSMPLIIRLAFPALKKARLSAGAVNILILSAVLIMCGYSYLRYPSAEYVYESINRHYPVKACGALADNPPEKSDSHSNLRVMTDFVDGGWCRWIMYQQNSELDVRVTFDGRTQGVDGEYAGKAFGVYEGDYGWQQTIREIDPDVILVRGDHPLSRLLLANKDSYRIDFHDVHYAAFIPIRKKELSVSDSVQSEAEPLTD